MNILPEYDVVRCILSRYNRVDESSHGSYSCENMSTDARKQLEWTATSNVTSAQTTVASIDRIKLFCELCEEFDRTIYDVYINYGNCLTASPVCSSSYLNQTKKSREIYESEEF